MPEHERRTAGAVPVTPTAQPAWPRWWPAGLAWALWVLTVLGLAAAAWLDHLLRQAGKPELISLARQQHSSGGGGGERWMAGPAGGQHQPDRP